MATRKTTPLADRLLAKRVINEKGCWLFTGFLDRYGYGQIWYEGRIVKTHRAALHIWKGMPIDSPEWGLHSCDNPACFNPDHLTPGTPTENCKHTWERKRQRVGRNAVGHFTPPSDDDLPF